jgi:Mn-containing catalase
MAASKTKATKSKKVEKTYHASIVLNTTKAPFQVSGAFISASADYIKVRGEVGDDIGKVIMVPVPMVKVIYLTEDS